MADSDDDSHFIEIEIDSDGEKYGFSRNPLADSWLIRISSKGEDCSAQGAKEAAGSPQPQ